MAEPSIHVADTVSDAVNELSLWLQGSAVDAVRDHGFAAWALSGGSTPIPLYQQLAADTSVPWSAIRLYLVDERDVGRLDPLSNFRMIRETLLDALPTPPQAVYPWLTLTDSRESLAQYRQALSLLSRDAGFPQLDVAIQGMGGDGHTASVFPGSPQEQSPQWVAYGPGPEASRLTLTLPLLAQARKVVFLVTGRDKAERVREVLQDPRCPLPAAWLSRHSQNVHWFLDAGSASRL